MAICISPYVRYMILCDEVLQDEERARKLTIVGLTSLVVWPSEVATSVRLETLVVLLILTDGRGTGTGQILCVNEETGELAFRSASARISFEGESPLGHHGVVFRMRNCRFPKPGAYLVQFLFNDALVQEQIIIVR